MLSEAYLCPTLHLSPISNIQKLRLADLFTNQAVPDKCPLLIAASGWLLCSKYNWVLKPPNQQPWTEPKLDWINRTERTEKAAYSEYLSTCSIAAPQSLVKKNSQAFADKIFIIFFGFKTWFQLLLSRAVPLRRAGHTPLWRLSWGAWSPHPL